MVSACSYDNKTISCVSPVGWLNNNLIIAVQNLLKKQSPILGFHLGQSMGFKIQQGEFIQILHDGQGHWLMISSAITEDGAQKQQHWDNTIRTYTKKQMHHFCKRVIDSELKIMNAQNVSFYHYFGMEFSQQSIFSNRT